MLRYTTRQAARQLGISLISLTRYIAAKKVPAPRVQKFGGKFRVWSEKDIEKVCKLLPKIANGRKTRYQKQQRKTQKPQPRAAVPHKQRKKHK